jgi:hypothetical protein
MLVRGYIYCHLAAVLLAAPAQYWDGKSSDLFHVGLAAIFATPLFLAALLVILCSRKISAQKKVFALTVGIAATICQAIALIPLIQ